tara:strand:- start:463 stop:651 length:189 start_codon:yes stop_codon:yes gene_type:complete
VLFSTTNQKEGRRVKKKCISVVLRLTLQKRKGRKKFIIDPQKEEREALWSRSPERLVFSKAL